jgi:uncharacterized protein (TIGR03083 family)
MPVALLDVTPALAPERVALLSLLRGLAAEDWERPTECPEWTVQGLVLHVLGDDLSLLSRQRDAAPSGLIGYAVDHPGVTFRALLDGFNEQWVTAASFLSTELVLELLRLVGEWSDTFYREVGLETVSREPVGLFAESEPSPYWQVIAREYDERFIHQSQIRRAVGAPELEGELVVWVARVTAHLFAAWLVELAAAPGTTIGFAVEGAGRWTVQRDEDCWRARDGGEDVDALVTLPAAVAVPALSRGVALDELWEQLVITGDDALARGALDVFLPLLIQP